MSIGFGLSKSYFITRRAPGYPAPAEPSIPSSSSYSERAHAEYAGGVAAVPPEADIVVVQRGVTSFIEAIVEQAQAMGKRVVYEVDDLITEIPDFLPHHQEYLKILR